MARSLPRPERVRVLLIGTTDGPNGLTPVAGDLAAMREVLTDPETGITGPAQVRTLPEPTVESVLRAVRGGRWWRRTQLLVIYFSGHGYLDPEDQSLRLEMADSARVPNRPDSFGLAYRRLATEALRSRARQIVIILDCCYSGRALENARLLDKLSVLASAQGNRQTPLDPRSAVSPFTEVLVTALREPPSGHRIEGVNLGDLARYLSDHFHKRYLPIDESGLEPTPEEIKRLSEAERQAHYWSPQYSYTGATVVLGRPEGRPAMPRPRFWWARAALRAALRWLPHGTKARLALGLGAALAVLAGAVWFDVAGTNAAVCPPPTELRVLASTEDRPALAAAANDFEQSALDHHPLSVAGDHTPDGCRRITLSVYAAQSNRVLAAFAEPAAWSGLPPADPSPSSTCGGAQDGCLAPLRGVGPQPDLWIPDSSAELVQAQAALPAQNAGVTLTAQGSVAVSPLVLAVPEHIDQVLKDAKQPSTGSSWSDLLAPLRQAKVPVLRPSPTTSGTGLLQTVGLYLGYEGKLGSKPSLSDPRKFEGGSSPQGLSVGDSQQLLCSLLNLNNAWAQSALLVSEQAIGGPPGPDGSPAYPPTCPNGQSGVTLPKLTAYQPAGLPVLDHPLVAVGWPGEHDQPVREAAARLFRQYLLDPNGGGRTMAHHGFRLPSGESTPAEPTIAQIRTTLTEYANARTPAEVLFELDLSSSMTGNGKLSQAKSALQLALDVLEPQDDYGIWTFPAGSDQQTDTAELVRLGSQDPADGKQKVAELSVLPKAASLYEAITQGLDKLSQQPDARPRRLVVLTDGDDRSADEATTAQSEMVKRTQNSAIQVVLVAFPDLNCGDAAARTATYHGTCLPANGDLGKQLAGLVAAVDSGGVG